MNLSNDILNLAEVLGGRLQQKNWKISCAESCTGGGIGYAITSVSGSSSWFEQGFITYSNEAKAELLGVSQTDLKKHGAVSEAVVLQMSEGAALNAKANLAVSVSGVAGPGGGTADKPVGTVWFGRYCNGQTTACRKVFAGDRHEVREQTIQFALEYCLAAL